MTNRFHPLPVEPVTLREVKGVWNTPTKLLSSGEKLIGSRGYQGVSLEKIATQAGQGNKYAVQYHFKTKAKFAEAILVARRGSLEQRRRAWAALLRKEDREDLESCVAAMFWPIAEQVDEQGQYSFARFLLQFHVQFERWTDISPAAGLSTTQSATIRLIDRMLELAGEEDREVFIWKVSLATVTFCSALIGMEQEEDLTARTVRLGILSRMVAASLRPC